MRASENARDPMDQRDFDQALASAFDENDEDFKNKENVKMCLIDQIEARGIEQGFERGLERGLEEGEIRTLWGLVRKGRLTVDEAAEEVGLTVEAFATRAKELLSED